MLNICNVSGGYEVDFIELVQTRQSVRNFQTKDIEQDRLNKILELTNKAPSAGNLQAYKIVVVRDPVTREALSVASFNKPFIRQAPVSLVFCADTNISKERFGERGEHLYSLQDATIAATYCQLAITALGLASIWAGAFDNAAVSKVIKTPTGVYPVAIISLGIPDETPEQKPRRKLAETLVIERFK